MECLSAAINYLEVVFNVFMCSATVMALSPQLLADETNFSSYQLQQLDCAGHLRLDSSAARALSLELAPGEPQTSSLIGLMSKCQTPQGQRLMSQWLKQPLIDKSCIGEECELEGVCGVGVCGVGVCGVGVCGVGV